MKLLKALDQASIEDCQLALAIATTATLVGLGILVAEQGTRLNQLEKRLAAAGIPEIEESK